MLHVSLDNLIIIFLTLFNDSHISQVDCFKLNPNAHEFIFKLNKFALTIDFLLYEVKPDKLIYLIVKIFNLDVFTLDHSI